MAYLIDGDACCALLGVTWPPVLLFGVIETLVVLLVDIQWGYWTCAFIPIYLCMFLTTSASTNV